MQILIDGDACNVIPCTETIAKAHNIICHIYCDTQRILESDYSDIHIVDRGRDSADFAILNKCDKYDIVITNDTGLAAMLLAKEAYVINSHGFEYTKQNIDSYLTTRYLRSFAQRKSHRNQVKGIMPHEQKKENYKQLLTKIIRKSERTMKTIHEQELLY